MVHGSHFSKCGIYAMAAQDNSTRDTDLIKSLITVTFISLLIFQLKYLLPYVSALNACALPLLHITQKHCRSGIPLCYSQRQQKQKANSSHALPSQGLTEPSGTEGTEAVTCCSHGRTHPLRFHPAVSGRECPVPGTRQPGARLLNHHAASSLLVAGGGRGPLRQSTAPTD